GPDVVPGSYSVVVAGTEGTITHPSTITLVVPEPDFTLPSASPSSLRVARGTSGTSTIATTASGVGTITLAVTGEPTGVTTLLDRSVLAGENATLTVSVDETVAAGDYTLTITGTEGAATHSITVPLTVTWPLLNAGFELGSLKDWTRAGTTSISTTAYSGSYSGECGASTATGDVSMLFQTFVLPPNAKTLGVWYDMTCLGTLAVDWGGAKLKDDATGTILYLLPNTCTQGQGWQEASADVSAWAGHEVTVTLYNHDDGDPSTPTYTLFDDVHVGY